MAPQFSLAYLTVLGCLPPEMTYIASRTGYDFVSFRPIHMGVPGEPAVSLTESKLLLKETKKAMAETGMKLLDIELARICDGTEPKSYLPAMEVAAELGGCHVLSSIWTDDRSFAVERFVELCELADPFGLTVELEFVPIASVSTLAEAVDILKAAKQENAGLMIDVHHFHRSKEKVEDLQQLPRDWFRFLHLCDAQAGIPQSLEEMTRILREERSYVGEGGIDVAAIVTSLPEMPYSIELPHTKRLKEMGYEKFAQQCLEAAKSYFSKHQLAGYQAEKAKKIT
ncbi:sugar phosphate isomerase/epimerase [Domibacillus indicus]|uniref:sugar phosphate isomerase/epimerase family protein n=1 Tax=Domibacillus indicus TaxID=1437523 RepID=UPI00203EC800|nr:sugar phosphate isomerase/epimerase [Domibacillus indicus]MCM3788966.1 sugar phosphate isomerase/epimerase [Domibacillus indicus]